MQKLLLLCLLFLGLSFSSFAQNLVKSDVITYDVLVFENFAKGDMRFVRQGAPIKYALKSSPKQKQQGVFEKVVDKNIIIDGQSIPLSDLAYIKARVQSDKKMIGGLLAGAGIATTAFSVGIGNKGGLAMAGLGLVATGYGISLITSAKKFNFYKGWEVSGGTLEYIR